MTQNPSPSFDGVRVTAGATMTSSVEPPTPQRRRPGTVLRRARAIMNGVYGGWPYHELRYEGDVFTYEYDPELEPPKGVEFLDDEPGESADSTAA